MTLDFKDLEIDRIAFTERLEVIRSEGEPHGGWYRYGSMANFGLLVELQPVDGGISGISSIADIGGADGDMSFYLSSKGYDVELIDHAETNANGLEGAKMLRDALNSNVAIYDVDLDKGEQLPRESYDLVLFLGILYHLENPYMALKMLSNVSKNLILSTKISSRDSGGNPWFENQAVAYLVDTYECNNDPTNFWVFSPAGLRRMISRTGWKILSERRVGAVGDSEPASMEKDERMFVWLQSTKFEQQGHCPQRNSRRSTDRVSRTGFGGSKFLERHDAPPVD